MSRYSYYGFAPYVSVAEKRRRAAAAAAKLSKASGSSGLDPVRVEGRKLVTTFWGKSWNENLERYRDYENRLPRGRSYLTHGSVIDLKISPGVVSALVSGSELYKVKIEISKLSKPLWSEVKKKCAGQIDSLIGLLQGKIPDSVMQTVTHAETGLFPSPRQIQLSCSCPDYATMCKHVAAVMYGIGVRLDKRPDLLFLLRDVDHTELISEAAGSIAAQTGAASTEDALDGDLGSIFGIEMDAVPTVASTTSAVAVVKKAIKKAVKKTPAKKAAKKIPAKKSAKKATKKAAKKAVKKAAKKATKSRK